VSTRRLIALALACGLAILLAGGVWLVLAGRGTDDDLVASFLPEGATAEVGGLVVGVIGSRLARDGVLVLDVQMVAGPEAVGAPGRSWGVISGRGLVERPEDQTGAPHTCAAQDLPAGGELSCSIAFRPTPDQQASQLVAVFGRDGQRASWELAPRAG
jgi:hypothetical protein